MVCDGRGSKQPKAKRTGTTFNQLCCFSLILRCISKDVHVLLSPIGPTEITSLEKSKEDKLFSRSTMLGLLPVSSIHLAFQNDCLTCFIPLIFFSVPRVNKEKIKFDSRGEIHVHFPSRCQIIYGIDQNTNLISKMIGFNPSVKNGDKFCQNLLKKYNV